MTFDQWWEQQKYAELFRDTDAHIYARMAWEAALAESEAQHADDYDDIVRHYESHR